MPTIFDVAKLAGVSIKTVSRVMNDEANVREQTRVAVLEAVEKLSYRPHRGARMMRAQRSGIIGLVTGTISFTETDPIEAGLSSIHIVRGVQQVCRRSGHTLMVADPGDSQDDLLRLLETFRDYRADGVIYAANYLQQVAIPTKHGLPVVLANCVDGYGTPAFIPDDRHGQRLAVEYLVGRGHRKIGFVGLETELIAGQRRREAFVDAITEARLPYRHEWVAIGSRPRDDTGIFAPLEAVLTGMLAGADRPTAICFGNDVMALRAGAVIERLGLAVPQDISIMGYDNDVTIAEAVRPRLTTVQLPYLEMGRLAASFLLETLTSGAPLKPQPPHNVPGRIIERDSVRLLAE